MSDRTVIHILIALTLMATALFAIVIQESDVLDSPGIALAESAQD
jgi:hypothetical protein